MMAKYRILEGCTSASSTALALKMNGGMSVRSCSSSSSSKSFRALTPHYADAVRELSARQRIREMQQTSKPHLVPSTPPAAGDHRVGLAVSKHA